MFVAKLDNPPPTAKWRSIVDSIGGSSLALADGKLFVVVTKKERIQRVNKIK